MIERDRIHSEPFGGVLEAEAGHLVGLGIEAMHTPTVVVRTADSTVAQRKFRERPSRTR